MSKLFQEGAQFPPEDHVARIAKYKRNEDIFAGHLYKAYERASQILKDGNPKQKEQLEKLYIAVNLMDVILTKPADLMVGEEPIYESGRPDNSPEQQALNRIVEENELNRVIHETVIGAGIRGDAFLKVYHGYREDFSEIPEGILPKGKVVPDGVLPEPIIEAVDPKYVFPEVSRKSKKKFKAINIAWVEWVDVNDKEEIAFLNVERHVPGFIFYERYRLHENGVNTYYGAAVDTYLIGERVPTGRTQDIIETGVPRILIQHIPYKAVDTDWQGISGIEKLDSVLAAIQDRLVQIDYILHKHSDPAMYGPPLEQGPNIRTGGIYIEVTKEDQTPGYMDFDSKLDGAFKELDILIGLVFMLSETPQWLFGTTLSEDKGGTGTSHTDGVAIKARFMPILSKVKRIRVHVDRAIRNAIYEAMNLENIAYSGVDDFQPYEPIYPKIIWKDGIPANEKEQAEIMALRTGNRPTIDQRTAIKVLEEIDDDQAEQIIQRIKEEEASELPVNPDKLFNPPAVSQQEAPAGGGN